MRLLFTNQSEANILVVPEQGMSCRSRVSAIDDDMTWIQQIFGPSVQPGHVATTSLVGYIIGCLTTGYYLVRFRLGLDIRDSGSGSVGARNAGRILGIQGFFITLMGDFAKGAVVVWFTRYITGDERLAGLAMLAVVIGHIWPLQLGFRGGKGVATSLGALAVYDFHLGLIFVALFCALFLVLMRVTMAGLIAFTLLPVAAMFLGAEPMEAIIISVLAGMVLLAHRRNLYEEIALAGRREVESETHKSVK